MRRPSSREPRLARGSLTEEAHAHVCINGFGEGGEVEAVVGLWGRVGGAGRGEGKLGRVHTLAQSHLGLRAQWSHAVSHYRVLRRGTGAAKG